MKSVGRSSCGLIFDMTKLATPIATPLTMKLTAAIVLGNLNFRAVNQKRNGRYARRVSDIVTMRAQR